MNNTIRIEINKIIEALPESQLKPVLEYLRQVEKTAVKQQELAANVNQIFEEEGLLKKLMKG